MENIKICCPSCGWLPNNKNSWKCSCGNIFNAFDTVGKCPCCKTQWEYTQCVEDEGGCNDISLHEDWYQGLNEIVDHLFTELQITKKPNVV